jgi:peptide/nickel transport system permease protein
MLRLIGRRLALSIPLLIGVTAATFLLVALIPGNVAREILGPTATQAQYLQLKHALGLSQPLPVRYWHWLTAALRGDLGASAFSGESVTSLLDSRLGVTLDLVVLATILASLLGITLGIAGALLSGTVGRAIDSISLLGMALPEFVLGLVLVALLAVTIEIFPATGYVPFAQSPGEWARSMVLPVVTLSVPSLAIIAKQTRDSMRDVLGRPFIRTLQAAGVPRRSILFKHALRNAAIPVATVIGLVFIGILGGSILVEDVFAIPGLGGLAVQATTQHDVPLILGTVVYFTVIVVLMNLLVDLAYGWLDPRVRVS